MASINNNIPTYIYVQLYNYKTILGHDFRENDVFLTIVKNKNENNIGSLRVYMTIGHFNNI